MEVKIITILIGVYLMWVSTVINPKNLISQIIFNVISFFSGLFLIIYYTLMLTK